MSTITYDLGEGLGLGKYLLPVFPPPASSVRDFLPYPYACTRQARDHLVSYARTCAEYTGLAEDDAAAVARWAEGFFAVWQPWSDDLNTKTLECILSIVWNHTEWPTYGPIFQSAISRVRGRLADARERGKRS